MKLPGSLWREAATLPNGAGPIRPGNGLRRIRGGCLYVEEAEGKPAGVFAFLLGPEPNYERIDGAWRNSLPYGTIHRVASDGRVPGFFGRCMEFCKKQTANLRIDTHEENKVMRHLIEKSGFAECGIIRVEDGSPRIAYQYVGERADAAKEQFFFAV